MKAFVKKIILFSLLPIIILVSINYFYDPANLFDPEFSYERSIANYLNEGWNVTNVGNMDERMLQKYFIEGMKTAPDVVVMGSSNSMYIDSSFYPGQKLINNAVSSATFHDFLAIYDIYESKGFKPKKVVLGIAPYMLIHPTNDFWLSYKEDFFDLSDKIGIEVQIKNKPDYIVQWEKWKQLFSLSYFQQSVNRMFNNKDIHITHQQFGEGSTKVNDGSYNDGQYYLKKSSSQIDVTVKRFIASSTNEFSGYTEINKEQKELLINFVDYLIAQNIEIEFFMMALHPIYYDYVSNKYPIVHIIDDFLSDLAKQKNIKVIGTIDPDQSGLKNSDFNDYCHLNLNGFYKTFNIYD